MPLRDRLLGAVVAQLGRPSGPVGRVVALLLNRSNRRVVIATVDAVAPSPGCVAVDIGFGGAGGLARLLPRVAPGGVVHGVEISRAMLTRAHRRHRREQALGQLMLHEAPMHDLPFADRTVDVVVSTHTIYFIADLDAAFAEVARVLRPGGRLALGVDNPEAMLRLAVTDFGFRVRPVDEITQRLERSGFGPIDVRRANGDERGFAVIVAVAGST